MHCAPLWNFDSTKILTRRVLAIVLADLKAKAEWQANVRRNLVIVRPPSATDITTISYWRSWSRRGQASMRRWACLASIDGRCGVTPLNAPSHCCDRNETVVR